MDEEIGGTANLMDTETRRGVGEEMAECGCTWLARDSHRGPQHSKGDLCDSGMSLHSKASLAFRHCLLESVFWDL